MNWEHLRPLLPLLGAAALLVVVAAMLLAREAAERELASRLTSVRIGGPVLAARRGVFALAIGALRRLGTALRRRMFSPAEVRELEGMLTAAGFNASSALPLLVLAKAAALVLVPLAGWLATLALGIGGKRQIAVIGLALAGGTMLPNLVLGVLRRPYIASLRRGVPDALDLMVVCANAGLGLESAVDRVAREMRRASPAVAIQFETLGHEMRLLPDRREALRNLGERTSLPAFRRLGATLAQALRYGTPLSQALRALAGDMREERMVRFEERTARLPALMVLPTAGFILPVLFIVLAGPSVAKLFQFLHGMLQ
jgi:tight adherence protein C